MGELTQDLSSHCKRSEKLLSSANREPNTLLRSAPFKTVMKHLILRFRQFVAVHLMEDSLLM